MNKPGEDAFVPLFLLQIPQKTLARFGFTPRQWGDLLQAMLQVDVQGECAPEALISLRDFCRVFRVARNLFGPERFLQAYIEDARPWQMGPVGLAMEAAPTLDDALALWVGNASLLAPMLDIAVRDSATTRQFEARLTADLGDITETYMELILLLSAGLLRLLSGAPLAVELRFAHERQLPADFYRGHFGVDPVVGQRQYALVVDRRETARPNDHHALLTYRGALEGIAALRAAVDRHLRLGFQVRKHLCLAAEDGLFPGLEEVAARFNMSERTFARRLQDEGVTFRDLRGEVQNDMARRLLRKSSVSLKAIVERAGYASEATFVRAFTAANGQTPDAFRAASQKAPDAAS